jgi:hypothetical protein
MLGLSRDDLSGAVEARGGTVTDRDPVADELIDIAKDLRAIRRDGHGVDANRQLDGVVKKLETMASNRKGIR